MNEAEKEHEDYELRIAELEDSCRRLDAMIAQKNGRISDLELRIKDLKEFIEELSRDWHPRSNLGRRVRKLLEKNWTYERS